MLAQAEAVAPAPAAADQPRTFGLKEGHRAFAAMVTVDELAPLLRGLQLPQAAALAIKYHTTIATDTQRVEIVIGYFKAQLCAIAANTNADKKLPVLSAAERDRSSADDTVVCIVTEADVAAAAAAWNVYTSVDHIAILLCMGRMATAQEKALIPGVARLPPPTDARLSVALAHLLRSQGVVALRDAVIQLWLLGGSAVEDIEHFHREELHIPLPEFYNARLGDVKLLGGLLTLSIQPQSPFSFDVCLQAAIRGLEQVRSYDERCALMQRVLRVTDTIHDDDKKLSKVKKEIQAWFGRGDIEGHAQVLKTALEPFKGVPWAVEVMLACKDDAQRNMANLSNRPGPRNNTRADRNPMHGIHTGRFVQDMYHPSNMNTMLNLRSKQSKYRGHRDYDLMLEDYHSMNMYHYRDERDVDIVELPPLPEEIFAPFVTFDNPLDLLASDCNAALQNLTTGQVRQLSQGINQRHLAKRSKPVDFMDQLERSASQLDDATLRSIVDVWGYFLASVTSIEKVTSPFARRVRLLSHSGPHRTFYDAMCEHTIEFKEMLRQCNYDDVVLRIHQEDPTLHDLGTLLLVKEWDELMKQRTTQLEHLKWFLPLLKNDSEELVIQGFLNTAAPKTLMDLVNQANKLNAYHQANIGAHPHTMRIMQVSMEADLAAKKSTKAKGSMIKHLNEQNCAFQRRKSTLEGAAAVTGWTIINLALDTTYTALVQFKDEIRFADYKILWDQKIDFQAELKVLRNVFPEFDPGDRETQIRVDLVILALYIPKLVEMFKEWGTLQEAEIKRLDVLAAFVDDSSATTSKFNDLLREQKASAVLDLCRHDRLMDALRECRRFRSMLTDEKWTAAQPEAEITDLFMKKLDEALVTGSKAMTIAINNAKLAAGCVRLTFNKECNTVDSFSRSLLHEIDQASSTEADDAYPRLTEAVTAVERALDVLEDALNPDNLEIKIAKTIATGTSFLKLLPLTDRTGTSDGCLAIDRVVVHDGKVDEALSKQLEDIHIRLGSDKERHEVFLRAWDESQKVIDAVMNLDAVRFPLRASALLKRITELRWRLTQQHDAIYEGDLPPQHFIANCKVVQDRWTDAINSMGPSLRRIPLIHLRVCVEEMATRQYDRLPHIVGGLTRSGPLVSVPFKEPDAKASPVRAGAPATTSIELPSKSENVDDAPENYLESLHALVERQQFERHAPRQNMEISVTEFDNTDRGVATFMSLVYRWCVALFLADQGNQEAPDATAKRIAFLSSLEFFTVTESVTNFDVDSLFDRVALGFPICVIVTRNAIMKVPGIVTRLVNNAVERHHKNHQHAAVLFAFSKNTQDADAAKKWTGMLPAVKIPHAGPVHGCFADLGLHELRVYSGAASTGKTTAIAAAKPDGVNQTSLFLTEETCCGVEAFQQGTPSVLAVHVTAGVLAAKPLNIRVRDPVTGPLRLALFLHTLHVHRKLVTFDASSSQQHVVALHKDTTIVIEDPVASATIGLFVKNNPNAARVLPPPDVRAKLRVTPEVRAVAALHAAYKTHRDFGATDKTKVIAMPRSDEVANGSAGATVTEDAAARVAVDECLADFCVPRSNWREIMNFVKLLALLWKIHKACRTVVDYKDCVELAKYVATPGVNMSLSKLPTDVKILVSASPNNVGRWDGKSIESFKGSAAGFKNRTQSLRNRCLALVLAGGLGEGPRTTTSAPELTLELAIQQSFWLSEEIVFRAIFCGLRALAGIHTIVAGSPAAGKTRVAEFTASLIAKFEETTLINEYHSIYLSSLEALCSPQLPNRDQIVRRIQGGELRSTPRALLDLMKPLAKHAVRDALREARDKTVQRCVMLNLAPVLEELKDVIDGDDYEDVKAIDKCFKPTLAVKKNHARALAFPGMTGKKLRQVLSECEVKSNVKELVLDVFSTANKLDDQPGNVNGLLAVVVDECNTLNTGVLQTFFNDDFLDGMPVSRRVVRVGAINPYQYAEGTFMVNELPPNVNVHRVTIAQADHKEQNAFFRGIITSKLSKAERPHQAVAVDLICKIVEAVTALDIGWDSTHNNREITRVDAMFRAYLRLHGEDVDDPDALMLEAVVVATNATYVSRTLHELVKKNEQKKDPFTARADANKEMKNCLRRVAISNVAELQGTNYFAKAFATIVGRGHVANKDWFGKAYRNAIERTVTGDNFRAPPGIHLTETMREYLFLTLVSIMGKVPLTFVDVPGTGKTTALNVIAVNMLGPHSATNFFKRLPKLIMVQFQGRDSTTAEVVAHHFDRAVTIHRASFKNKPDTDPIVCVLYDEAGMARDSTANKALHEYLDRREVMCVALSNSNFDAAVNSRFLVMNNLSKSTDTLTELTKLMFAGAGISDKQAAALVHAYTELCEKQKRNTGGRGFHHHRDYLYMLRCLAASMRATAMPVITWRQLRDAVARNFGGMSLDVEDLKTTVTAFLQSFNPVWTVDTSGDDTAQEPHFEPFTPKGLLEVDRRISDEAPRQASARFLLFITESPDMIELEHWQFQFKNSRCETLWPSPLLGDITEGQEAKYASKLRYLAKVGGNLELLSYLGPVVSPSHGVMNRQPSEMSGDNGEKILFEILTIAAVQERIEIHTDFSVVAYLPRVLVEKTPEATLSRFEKHSLTLPPLNEAQQESWSQLKAFVELLHGCVVGCDAGGLLTRSVVLLVNTLPSATYHRRCALQLLDQACPHAVIMGAPKIKDADVYLQHYFETRERFDLSRFVERASTDKPWTITTHDKKGFEHIRLRGYTHDTVGNLTARTNFQFCIVDTIAHSTEDSLRDAIVAEVNNGSGPVLVLATTDDDVPFLRHLVGSCFKSSNFLAIVVLLPMRGERLDPKVNLASKKWHAAYMDSLDASDPDANVALNLVRAASKTDTHSKLHLQVIEHLARSIIDEAEKKSRANEGVFTSRKTEKTADALLFYAKDTTCEERERILLAALNRHALRTALTSWFAFPALQTMMLNTATVIERMWESSNAKGSSESIKPFGNAFKETFFQSTFVKENRRVIELITQSWGLVSILAADREKRLATVAELIRACTYFGNKASSVAPPVTQSPPSCYFEPWFGVWCREMAAVYPDETPKKIAERLPPAVRDAWSEGWPSICLVEDARRGLIGVHPSIEAVKDSEGLPRQLLVELYKAVSKEEDVGREGSASFAVGLMIALQASSHYLARNFQFFANLYYLHTKVCESGNVAHTWEKTELWRAVRDKQLDTHVNEVVTALTNPAIALEAKYNIYVTLVTYLAADDRKDWNDTLAQYRHSLYSIVQEPGKQWHPLLGLSREQLASRRDWAALHAQGYPFGSLVCGVIEALEMSPDDVERAKIADLIASPAADENPRWLVDGLDARQPSFDAVLRVALLEWGISKAAADVFEPQRFDFMTNKVEAVHLSRHLVLRIAANRLVAGVTKTDAEWSPLVAWLSDDAVFKFVVDSAAWLMTLFTTLSAATDNGKFIAIVRRLSQTPAWEPRVKQYLVPSTLPPPVAPFAPLWAVWPDHCEGPVNAAQTVELLQKVYHADTSRLDEAKRVLNDNTTDASVMSAVLGLVACGAQPPVCPEYLKALCEVSAQRVAPDDFKRKCVDVLRDPTAAMDKLLGTARAKGWDPHVNIATGILSDQQFASTRAVLCKMLEHCVASTNVDTFVRFARDCRGLRDHYVFADFYDATQTMIHGLDCGFKVLIEDGISQSRHSTLSERGAHVCLALAYAAILAHLLVYPEYLDPNCFNPAREISYHELHDQLTDLEHPVLEHVVTMIAAIDKQLDCSADDLGRGAVVAVAERLRTAMELSSLSMVVWNGIFKRLRDPACNTALTATFATPDLRDAAEVAVERFLTAAMTEDVARETELLAKHNPSLERTLNDAKRVLRLPTSAPPAALALPHNSSLDAATTETLCRANSMGEIQAFDKCITEYLSMRPVHEHAGVTYRDMKNAATTADLDHAAGGYQRFYQTCGGKLDFGCHNGEHAEVLPKLNDDTLVADLQPYLGRCVSTTVDALFKLKASALKKVTWDTHGLLRGAMDRQLGMFAPRSLKTHVQLGERLIWTPGAGMQLTMQPAREDLLAYAAAAQHPGVAALFTAIDSVPMSVNGTEVENVIAKAMTVNGNYDRNFESLVDLARQANELVPPTQQVADDERQNYVDRLVGLLRYALWEHRYPLVRPSTEWVSSAWFEEPLRRAVLIDASMFAVRKQLGTTLGFISAAYAIFSDAKKEWGPARLARDLDQNLIWEMENWVTEYVRGARETSDVRNAILTTTMLLGTVFKNDRRPGASSDAVLVDLLDARKVEDPFCGDFPETVPRDYGVALWLLLSVARHELVEHYAKGIQTRWDDRAGGTEAERDLL